MFFIQRYHDPDKNDRNRSDTGDKAYRKIYNSYCTCLKETVDGKLQCKCLEDTAIFDWVWQDQQFPTVRMLNEGKEVIFHPVYSSGTAVVRGQQPFQQNYHYYWEIKVISKLYGTDLMVGIGTSKLIQEEWQYKFCSLLGIDSESWGYSYHGNIQHNKLRRKYGVSFGLGSVIGVHLDMCSGTLEYFVNRKSMGVAFKNLKGKELYPMVSSTAAQSSIRITCCMSKEPSMQMMCLKQIMQHPGLYNKYKNIPGLFNLYDKQFFWMQPQVVKDEKKRLADLDQDYTLYLVARKKMRAAFISLLCRAQLGSVQRDDSVDIYDFNLESEGQHPDVPSTSGSSNSSNTSRDVPEFNPTGLKCILCLSLLEECQCLDDSDTENDVRELSEIL